MFKQRSNSPAKTQSTQTLDDILLATLASEVFFNQALDVLANNHPQEPRRKIAVKLFNAIGKAADNKNISQMQMAQTMCASIVAPNIKNTP